MRVVNTAFSFVLALAAAGCGGGGGDSSPVAPSAGPTSTVAAMVDSYGTAMPQSFDNGGADAAGADGGTGDGNPIPNAPVVLTDSAGHSVQGTTDANGVYHVRIDGFVAPMIAKVTRADGIVWTSPSISTVARRGFINISINGLTDKLASDVAAAAGKATGSSELTPALVAAHLPALASAKSNLNAVLSTVLIAAGLDPASFDPVTALLVTNHAGYDFVLDNTVITKATNNAPTDVVVSPTFTAPGALSGNWQLTYSGSVTIGDATQPLITTVSNLSGNSVPTSLAQVQAQQTGANFCANALKSNGTSLTTISCTDLGSGNWSWTYSFTSEGISSTITLADTNMNFGNYVGCGTCGVGSTVSYSQSFTETIGDGSSSPLVATVVNNYSYLRLN